MLSSTNNAKNKADNCIDGETGDNKLCHTKSEAAPWLAIDYGRQVIVKSVKIFNRINLAHRLKNVDVRVADERPKSDSGNEMFTGGHLLGHFKGPAEKNEEILVSGQKHISKLKIPSEMEVAPRYNC